MRITVVLGGFSAEREVSLSSGLRIAVALRERRHTVTCLDPATGVMTAEQESALLAAGVGSAPPSLEALAGLSATSMSPSLGLAPEITGAECVFLALHGGQGEDGTVQALLDLTGVPYTGSGHLASALAMDKHLTKVVLRAAGVSTADWLMAPPPDSGAAPLDPVAVEAAKSYCGCSCGPSKNQPCAFSRVHNPL